MIADFKLNSKADGDCLVIDTFGYINNVGGKKIVDEFNSYRENGVNNLILNLKESKIVNSIGISFLIEIIEKLNESKGKLIFSNLDPTVEKTFTIMGLFTYAGLAVDVEEALKQL